MSLLKQKTEYIKRGAYDELYTPREAVEIILPFIPKGIKIIWECTTKNDSNISKILKEKGYTVINSNLDFLSYAPNHFDMIITNPPYSLKTQFLKRAFQLGKPFLFLLPLTTLEGKERNKLFREHQIQIIIPNKRFNFKPEKKSSAWFQTSWFGWKLNLDNDIIFIEVD